ncbi:MAG TPA: LysR family transcriptional regulator, partial [Myxococcota bacterium]|nr:LysR family transcriptional regulator [Myxococcota bacterium]
ISLLWHPRMDGDPAHRWLRACVREVCATPGQTR